MQSLKQGIYNTSFMVLITRMTSFMLLTGMFFRSRKDYHDPNVPTEYVTFRDNKPQHIRLL